MCLTVPLLSLQKPATLSSSPFPWLQTLKLKQLQHIAQKTGLPSSGTKAALVRNLECGLNQHQHGNHDVRAKGGRKEMRILSIDMGIRNLAFAHLVSSFPSGSPGFASSFLDKGTGKKVILDAWRRISLPSEKGFSIQEFGEYLDTPLSSGVSQRQFQMEGELEVTSKKELGKEKEKDSFSLPVYAQHAHSIISNLLSRYSPTHILIERQRFRSGGGAAVQEWSLRVGVFEGMVWAVLHSLLLPRHHHQQQQHQRQEWGLGDNSGFGLKVFSIESGRVGRYWVPTSPAPSSTPATSTISGISGKKKKKSTAKEGKKLKIDLVGSWLENGDFEIGGDVDGWVDGYLAKWRSMSTPRSSRKAAKAEGVDIGKLDDLADCLVQGMTWLEWEGMKGRVVRDGMSAVGLELDSLA